MSPPFTPLFIDGEWRPASTGATFDVLNPLTGEVVGTSAAASAADCAAAVDAAQRAFDGVWGATSPSARRDLVLRVADLLATEKYRDKIVEAGNAETCTTEDMLGSAWHGQIAYLRGHAGFSSIPMGETFPSAIPGGRVFMKRAPYGVVFGIAPWNAPINLTIRAIVVPILCGNTVVIKCSEDSPRTQAIVIELFEAAGLPKGVINYISTSREDAPARTAEIIAHSMVRKISFTGSDRVGRIIAMEAAKHLKPTVLELGGKSPVVILADADVPRAARAVASSTLLNSGQICMSTERVIIQRGAAPAFLDDLAAIFKQVSAGDVSTPYAGARIGALFSEASAENVVALLKDAAAEGAKILVGDASRQGPLVQPHIVTEVKPGMRIWDRESFGPVVIVAVVDTVDEAVALANASDYSLMAALWTRDIYNAFGVSEKIRSGYVNINGPTVYYEWMRSLAGLGGSSGYGYFNVDEWTQLRMSVLHSEKEPPYPVVSRLNQ
ncbi:aldehyde dehydrogenase [Epithele typhae]|uniref:aldehyde dehydrogenase n=1 Tax=Epithele typhae TaxID=378194 RepID=UPI0020085D05|nr:aldehyde dehydrogenase [Epithele typhae]KAH9940869.1 aldehyde dehydrogenase [Epithele typhae]